MSLPLPSQQATISNPLLQLSSLEELPKNANPLDLPRLEFESQVSRQSVVSRRVHATFACLAEIGKNPISSQNILTSQQTLLNQQTLELKTFETSIQGFNQTNLTMQRFLQIDDELKSTSLETQLPEIPKLPLPGSLTDSITLYRQSNVEQNMATARMVSSVLGGIVDNLTQTAVGTGKFLTKTYRENCERHESNRQFCQKVETKLHDIIKTGDETLENVIHPLTQYLPDLSYLKDKVTISFKNKLRKPLSLTVELKTQFNISEKTSQQFISDSLSISTGLLSIIPLQKTVSFVSQAVKVRRAKRLIATEKLSAVSLQKQVFLSKHLIIKDHFNTFKGYVHANQAVMTLKVFNIESTNKSFQIFYKRIPQILQLAKEQGVKTLKIEAHFRNEKLLRIMKKRFPQFETDIRYLLNLHSETLVPKRWHTFIVPLEKTL